MWGAMWAADLRARSGADLGTTTMAHFLLSNDLYKGMIGTFFHPNLCFVCGPFLADTRTKPTVVLFGKRCPRRRSLQRRRRSRRTSVWCCSTAVVASERLGQGLEPPAGAGIILEQCIERAVTQRIRQALAQSVTSAASNDNVRAWLSSIQCTRTYRRLSARRK